MQYLSHNHAGILVLNSNLGSYFVLDVLSKHKTYFEILSKSNLHSKQTQEIIAERSSISLNKAPPGLYKIMSHSN